MSRASSIYKRQTRPLAREGAPQKQDRRLDTKTYWLTDRQSQCNFDFDFDNKSVCEEKTLVGAVEFSCEVLASGQRREHGSWRISIVRSRYQETTNGDCNRLITLECVTVNCKNVVISKGAIITCSYELCVQVVNRSNLQSKPRVFTHKLDNISGWVNVTNAIGRAILEAL
jgi:hypothetical protein